MFGSNEYNSPVQRFLICLLLIVGLTACGAGGGNENAAATTPDLATPVPFQTSTPVMTSTILPPVTTITLPTLTPVSYTVVKGDTLSSIAGRYGITVESLLAANPGVQPAALTVGTKLVIPAGEAGTAQPVPTPAPLPVRQARCWTEVSGGLWCFALVQNDFAETLENISAQVTLVDANGEALATQTVFALLDILPGGKTLPLAAHFPPPVQSGADVRVQVLTAVRLLPGDTRYLPVMLENSLVSVDASGRTARVSGRVVLTGTGTVNTLWVLATAYAVDGNVVGLRRWESTAPVTAETPAVFDFQVSSVGPAIDRVDFLAEARP